LIPKGRHPEPGFSRVKDPACIGKTPDVTSVTDSPSQGRSHQAGMRKPRHFHVYIMTNGPRSRVLYAGITGDLPRRVFEHKNKLYLASPANTT
jgi:hypothetical protein